MDRLIYEEVSPGLTIVAEEIPKFYSFSLGFFLNCGSRDEGPEEGGITHLIEHMLFKGTARKSSLEIVKFIEGLGGSFDAFTTKESLIIITKFLSEHIISVADLILEILLESKIAGDDLNKEKSVVLEEIKSSNDDPGEYVFELLFKILFPEHSMGRSIAGIKETIQKIDAEKARNHYLGILKKRMIIAISGNFNYQKFNSLIKKRFSGHGLAENKREKPPNNSKKILVRERKEISQVHLAFAIPSVSYSSPLRHPLLVLNTSLGGGMSSRLFQGLREKDGLVYDVHSFVDFYTDCGIFGFYLVCDKTNLKNVAKRLKIILDDIHKNGFDKEEIEIAKTYITGNLLLSLESSTNRMFRLGREMLYLKKVNPVDDVIDKIKSIEKNQIAELIIPYLDPKNFSIAAVGPITEKELTDIFGSLGD